MNLTQALRTDSIITLQSVIQQTDEDISFFGFRFVYNRNYNGKLAIDTLADRIMELAKQKKFEFSDEERAAGKKICARIIILYSNNKKKINEKNYFTRKLCKIRDFWKSLTDGYGTTYKWSSNDGHGLFNFYTKAQYETRFGPVPDYCHNYGYEENEPDRWYPPHRGI
jgi:hypothetical protein